MSHVRTCGVSCQECCSFRLKPKTYKFNKQLGQTVRVIEVGTSVLRWPADACLQGTWKMAAYERGASQTQLDSRFAEQVASQAEQAQEPMNYKEPLVASKTAAYGHPVQPGYRGAPSSILAPTSSGTVRQLKIGPTHT
ncbi:unnamed protein product [Durusdinium trenchii]|uniref:Uncharacterized protein n=1 Tax=Durusdinium trenchii TaxID=1381693 RepID=A0ABP0M6Z6_9DINO